MDLRREENVTRMEIENNQMWQDMLDTITSSTERYEVCFLQWMALSKMLPKDFVMINLMLSAAMGKVNEHAVRMGILPTQLLDDQIGKEK